MKKIMFNDRFGLTDAVLAGHKTMTRRIVHANNVIQIETSDGAVHNVERKFGSYHEYKDKDGKIWLAWSPFKIGEVIAVAQSYSCINKHGLIIDDAKGSLRHSAGWSNKMFVKADLMPHRIRITNIKVERLQDISNEDCRKEGIINLEWKQWLEQDITTFLRRNTSYGTFGRCRSLGIMEPFAESEPDEYLATDPHTAFAVLIFKLMSRETWEQNPWVFAYEFELIE